MSETSPGVIADSAAALALSRCFSDVAEYQRRLFAGEENDRLSWETRRMISDRLRSITDASGGR